MSRFFTTTGQPRVLSHLVSMGFNQLPSCINNKKAEAKVFIDSLAKIFWITDESMLAEHEETARLMFKSNVQQTSESEVITLIR